MDYAVLGRTGIRVSRLCLGTATFGVAPLAADAGALVGAALDAGVNFFDTANAYGNLPHFDRPTAPPAAQRHHPDPDTGLDETLRTLDELVRSGKVRHAALSTYPAWETVQALWICDDRRLHPPACVQVRYSLLDQRVAPELVPMCARFGLPVVAFSPLAGGLLAGRAAAGRQFAGERRWGGGGFTDQQRGAAARVEELAGRWGHPVHRVALGWLLAQPVVASAIIGVEHPAELAASLAALDLTLDPDQLAALGAIGAAVTDHAKGRG